MTTHISATRHQHSLVSIRLITDDVARLVDFYEKVSGTPVRWSTPDFAEVETPAGTLAIGSTRTVALLGPVLRVPRTTTPRSSSSSSTTSTLNTSGSGRSRPSSSSRRRRCRGAIGRCCSVTPTATSSTSSPLSRPRPRRSSDGERSDFVDQCPAGESRQGVRLAVPQ
jgi:hypothetical protein